MTATDKEISVHNADSAVLLIDAATSYKSFKDVTGDPEEKTKTQLAAAAGKDYEALRASHVAEHQKLFRRVSLDLGPSENANLPTDERIKKFPDANDPQFAELYYQYGRYLLISCSRPGTQPANLQGIWNESMSPPWGSKYTININTEMNYWPAESANLSECVEPLVAMVQDLSETGAPDGPRDVRRQGLGRASQHRPVAGVGADRRPELGHVAQRRRLVVHEPVGSLRL